MQETWVWSQDWEDALEEDMTICSSILAWEIPWTEEPGGLQSMGSQGVGHNWVTEHTHTHALSHMLISGQAGIQTKLFSSRSRTLNDYKPYCLQTHGSKLLPVREPLKSRDFIPHRHWDPCIPGCHGQNWVTPPTFVCWSHNPQGHCI